MNKIDFRKLKVVSVLIHPRSNAFLVQVTRSEGYFTTPQTTKWYSVSYDSPILDSFVRWASKLSALNVNKIVCTLKG